jgi:hypothetical protein
MIQKAKEDFVKEVFWLGNRLNSMPGSNVTVLGTSDECLDFSDTAVMALEINVADFRSNLLDFCKHFIADPSQPFDEDSLKPSW